MLLMLSLTLVVVRFVLFGSLSAGPRPARRVARHRHSRPNVRTPRRSDKQRVDEAAVFPVDQQQPAIEAEPVLAIQILVAGYLRRLLR